MSDQEFERLVAELREFLRARGVQLTTSDYDLLQLWTLREGDDPVEYIENKTERAQQ